MMYTAFGPPEQSGRKAARVGQQPDEVGAHSVSERTGAKARALNPTGLGDGERLA